MKEKTFETIAAIFAITYVVGAIVVAFGVPLFIIYGILHYAIKYW